MLYIMRVGRGHDWLVDAESEADALADWSHDAGEVNYVKEATPVEAIAMQLAGDTDVSDSDLGDWLLDRAVWQYSHCPTMDDDRAVGVDLVAGRTPSARVTLARGLWASGRLDTRSDGCGVDGDVDDYISVEDISWPSEDEAMAAVWGDDDGGCARAAEGDLCALLPEDEGSP